MKLTDKILKEALSINPDGSMGGTPELQIITEENNRNLVMSIREAIQDAITGKSEQDYHVYDMLAQCDQFMRSVCDTFYDSFDECVHSEVDGYVFLQSDFDYDGEPGAYWFMPCDDIRLHILSLIANNL